MTYTVSSGTLNSSIPYHTWDEVLVGYVTYVQHHMLQQKNITILSCIQLEFIRKKYGKS